MIKEQILADKIQNDTFKYILCPNNIRIFPGDPTGLPDASRKFYKLLLVVYY